jgi:predicted  nucleic acid-binding Zn-ribbon protein
MKTTMKTKTILMALGLAMLLAEAAQATQEQLAASMKETRLEAAQTRDQLAATLATLTALTKQEKGDLRPAYAAFTNEVSKTEAAATATRKRAAWMQGDGLKYFEDWQKTIDGINNESLRKRAQKRLDAVKKSYTKVTASFQEVGEKFKPFLADLADIQKLLANDVTASGIKAIRSTVSDANWRYKAVNRTINDALDEMAKMEKSLSTEAK